MANHDDRHRTQRHSEPIHESEQVCGIEFVRPRKGQPRRNEREKNADEQQSLRNRLQHRRRGHIELSSGCAHFPSSFFRPSLPLASPCSGTIVGKVAPEPGGPSKFGGGEGMACPAGTSAFVAFWLSCRARM